MEIFRNGLIAEYSYILPPEFLSKIDILIEKLQAPDLAELGVFPFKNDFLVNL